ncbi:hypothetical protein HK103_000851 [Boothiomyces macroporosus]|uniref:Uncharacterized protein n=1 Tax=Boothiomyces macroporosus TaxID=261099 RepID=A0AAD5UB13_9FUNG|nr:hypothetical protein HK103_000851 [Boothiomyces macroporosus]
MENEIAKFRQVMEAPPPTTILDQIQFNLFKTMHKCDKNFTLPLYKQFTVLLSLWDKIKTLKSEMVHTIFHELYFFMTFYSARLEIPRHFVTNLIKDMIQLHKLFLPYGFSVLVNDLPTDYGIEPPSTNNFKIYYKHPGNDEFNTKPVNRTTINQEWERLTTGIERQDHLSCWFETYPMIQVENEWRSINYPNNDSFGLLRSNDTIVGGIFDGCGSGSRAYFASNLGLVKFLDKCKSGSLGIDFLIKTYYELNYEIADIEECGNSAIGIGVDATYIQNSNLQVCQIKYEKGDVLIASSDGLGDNLDPIQISDSGEYGYNSWKDLSPTKHPSIITKLGQVKTRNLENVLKGLSVQDYPKALKSYCLSRAELEIDLWRDDNYFKADKFLKDQMYEAGKKRGLKYGKLDHVGILVLPLE